MSYISDRYYLYQLTVNHLLISGQQCRCESDRHGCVSHVIAVI